MTATLYLIAHKVRGEPAFDIAQKMEMSDGPWWIIPTSGHRAYPYWHTDLEYVSNEYNVPPMPVDHPDHYPLSSSIVFVVPPRSGRPLTPNPEDL